MSVNKMINVRDGEEVLQIVRRSWVSMLPQIVVIAALMVAPFFFAFPLLAYRPYGGYLLMAILLLGIFLAIRTFTQWYYTMFVITSFRVVDVYHAGFFDRQVTDAGFEIIQDVSFHKKGVISMIFNVGLIKIQTPGSNTMIEVEDVDEPEVVLGVINDARRALKIASPEVNAKNKLSGMLQGMDEDEVQEVIKIASEKKRERAAKEFFTDENSEE
ncbi:MAG: PH domain-containing protein [bacterium]